MTDTHADFTESPTTTFDNNHLHRRAIAVLACLRAELGLWGLVKLVVRECFR